MSLRSIRAQEAWKVDTQIRCAVSHPDESFKAGLHFARGFVGEGYGEDVERRYAVAAKQISDAVGYDARFAAAGARQKQQRTVGMLHRLPLHRIQGFKEVGHYVLVNNFVNNNNDGSSQKQAQINFEKPSFEEKIRFHPHIFDMSDYVWWAVPTLQVVMPNVRGEV